MNVREKLVELLTDNLLRIGNLPKCDNPLQYTTDEIVERIADHLIANGVTVQEWIPVKEHLPQENEPEGKVCEQVQVLLINGAVSTGWCNRLTKMWWHLGYGDTKFIGYEYDNTPVIAWQPLAQPPKGE